MTMYQVFLEALWDLSILPFGDQNTFYAMLEFEPQQATWAALIAALGAIGGCITSSLIGIVIGRQLNQTYGASAKFSSIKKGVAEYGWPLLMLVWAPALNFLPLIAAALGYPAKRTILICSLAMAGFYIYQCLNVA